MCKFGLFFLVTMLFVTGSSAGFAQSTPVELLKPIRQTTGRVNIMKFGIQKTPAGDYQWSGTQVCQKDILIDVYDGRGKGSFAHANDVNVECDTEIAGIKSTLMGSASIILRDQMIFTGEPVSEVRSNQFGLKSGPIGSKTVTNFVATAQVLSRDLKASAIVTADQGLNWDCSTGKCMPVGEESFMATVEFGP